MGHETHAITTMEEYRAVERAAHGVIVVTDTPTDTTRIHWPGCRTVGERTFGEKVIENGRRNGSYYFYLRAADAQSELGGRACGICGGAQTAGLQ